MSEPTTLRKQVADLTAKMKELDGKEKDLLERERHCRLISELVSDRIYKFVVNSDGEMELAGTILGKIGDYTGYTLDEVKSYKDWNKAVHPDDWQVIEQTSRDLRLGKASEYELRTVGKDGRITWLRVRSIPDWDEEKGCLKSGFYQVKDITPQKRAEEELLRLERVRALGQMAAGISHNLNNILTTILGPARLLEKEVTDPVLKQETEHIIRSARRAKDIVRRLNDAVRDGVDTNIRSLSINKIVEEAVELTRSIWKDESESKGVELQVRTELGNVPAVQGTRSGMLDIIVNLLLNAVDALPNGGEIVILTKPTDGGLLLTISDNGVGMDGETQMRIFEPFFTTKSEIGTGLGLSTVYGTITRWQGTVKVQSAVGKGSKFTIELPAFEGEDKDPDLRATPSDSRRARVLVVEDVEAIRSLLSRVLSQRHQVILAPDGEQALRRFESGGFDVAVIDLGLSEVPGDRVGHLLRQADPCLATILISGWELADDDPRVKGFDFRISKPFEDLDQLQHLVSEAVKLRDSRARRHP